MDAAENLVRGTVIDAPGGSALHGAVAPSAAGFVWERLDDVHSVAIGRLPSALLFDAAGFAALWNLHPHKRTEVPRLGGRLLPRWQQAYGVDYRFSGTTSHAVAIPQMLLPILQWCRAVIDARLNALLVNWYDGAQGHYIGAHRDAVKKMLEGAPTVTVSFGAARTFRLQHYRRKGPRRDFKDFEVGHGSVLVLPYAVNQHWTHAVPHFATSTGRRVSVTLRALRTGD